MIFPSRGLANQRVGGDSNQPCLPRDDDVSSFCGWGFPVYFAPGDCLPIHSSILGGCGLSVCRDTVIVYPNHHRPLFTQEKSYPPTPYSFSTASMEPVPPQSQHSVTILEIPIIHQLGPILAVLVHRDKCTLPSLDGYPCSRWGPCPRTCVTASNSAYDADHRSLGDY